MKLIHWIIPCGVLLLLLAAAGVCIATRRDKDL